MAFGGVFYYNEIKANEYGKELNEDNKQGKDDKNF